MIPGERLLRGTGMSRQVALPDRPYRWRGLPGWLPGDQGPMEEGTDYRPRRNVQAAQALMAERLAKFTALRDADVGVVEAGAAVGVSADRARKYERLRKQAADGGAA